MLENPSQSSSLSPASAGEGESSLSLPAVEDSSPLSECMSHSLDNSGFFGPISLSGRYAIAVWMDRVQELEADAERLRAQNEALVQAATDVCDDAAVRTRPAHDADCGAEPWHPVSLGAVDALANACGGKASERPAVGEGVESSESCPSGPEGDGAAELGLYRVTIDGVPAHDWLAWVAATSEREAVELTLPEVDASDRDEGLTAELTTDVTGRGGNVYIRWHEEYRPSEVLAAKAADGKPACLSAGEPDY